MVEGCHYYLLFKLTDLVIASNVAHEFNKVRKDSKLGDEDLTTELQYCTMILFSVFNRELLGRLEHQGSKETLGLWYEQKTDIIDYHTSTN